MLALPKYVLLAIVFCMSVSQGLPTDTPWTPTEDDAAFDEPTRVQVKRAGTSQVPYCCPATDKDGRALGQTTSNGGVMYCSYPTFAGENPNNHYCGYSMTTGQNTIARDAPCPATGVYCSNTRRNVKASTKKSDTGVTAQEDSAELKGKREIWKIGRK